MTIDIDIYPQYRYLIIYILNQNVTHPGILLHMMEQGWLVPLTRSEVGTQSGCSTAAAENCLNNLIATIM